MNHVAPKFTTDRPLIRAAIERLNWAHGWGDVNEIRRFMDGRIEVDIESRYRAPKTYIARTIGRESVTFRGYQTSYRKESPCAP